MDINTKIMALLNVKFLGRKSMLKIPESHLRRAENAHDLYDMLCDVALPRVNTTSDELQQYIDKAERDLDLCRTNNIVVFSIYDEVYPNKLNRLKDKPILMYTKGNIKALSDDGIAIIGTRNVSPLGAKIGERFGVVTAQSGRTVISGLATGCDTAGHKGCLSVDGGITIAIMATPLDKVYPKKNTNLAKQILEQNGCLLSEYCIGTPTTRSAFVERDRLQSGLADGVIVVETGLDGGSYHAIQTAKDLNEPIGCFSFPEDHYKKHESSLGNQKMIESKEAIPLRDHESIKSFFDECSGMPQSLSLF